MSRIDLLTNCNAAEYQTYFHHPDWQQVAGEICHRHNIPYQELCRSSQGENIIYLIDDKYVLKIFPPFRKNQIREIAALEIVDNRLSIPIPELIQIGEIARSTYIIMTQLHGQASRQLWISLELPDRINIITQLGQAISELHTLKLPEQNRWNFNWRSFIEQQATSLLERQRGCNVNPQWLEVLPSYISDRLSLLEANFQRPVFLHGDIHPGNLLLSQVMGRWQIAGLLDFGYSLSGDQNYEFVAPGVLMVQGDQQLQEIMLMAYGYRSAQLDENLRAVLMLLTILYEHSDLRKYALRLSPDAVNFSLEQLERSIWTFVKD